MYLCKRLVAHRQRLKGEKIRNYGGDKQQTIATGRIDMVVETTNIIYVLELKLSNNGGIDAATEQIRAKQYIEPFKADKRKVTALAIELDDNGKGLTDWKEV